MEKNENSENSPERPMDSIGIRRKLNPLRKIPTSTPRGNSCHQDCGPIDTIDNVELCQIDTVERVTTSLNGPDATPTAGSHGFTDVNPRLWTSDDVTQFLTQYGYPNVILSKIAKTTGSEFLKMNKQTLGLRMDMKAALAISNHIKTLREIADAYDIQNQGVAGDAESSLFSGMQQKKSMSSKSSNGSRSTPRPSLTPEPSPKSITNPSSIYITIPVGDPLHPVDSTRDSFRACFFCRESGHLVRNCPSNSSASLPRRRLDFSYAANEPKFDDSRPRNVTHYSRKAKDKGDWYEDWNEGEGKSQTHLRTLDVLGEHNYSNPILEKSNKRFKK